MGTILKTGVSLLSRGIKNLASGRGRSITKKISSSSARAFGNMITVDHESSDNNHSSNNVFSTNDAVLVAARVSSRGLLPRIGAFLLTNPMVLALLVIVIVIPIAYFALKNNSRSLISLPSKYNSSTAGAFDIYSSETTVSSDLDPFIER